MKRSKAVIDSIASYLEGALPPSLVSRNVAPMGLFVKYPPVDMDELVCATYLGTGRRSVDENAETVMVQLQLPGVLDPIDHHDAMVEVLGRFNEAVVWADSVSFTFACFYPGEITDGGGSSFLIYEVTVHGMSDDCMEDV